MTVLLTGASGYLGGALLAATRSHGIAVRPVFRNLKARNFYNNIYYPSVVVPTLLGNTDWRYALSGIDVVLHCAASLHFIKDLADDALTAFRKVNVDGTLNLARQAVSAGVRRFIFVSSIKVNGEYTNLGDVFKDSDLPCPLDPYAISKHEAEEGLRKIAKEHGIEVVIVRPPLVYGPKVKGNFAALMRCVQYGVPLPLGSLTENRRSLVALDNLVDLLVRCITHPRAADEIFLVSDGEDLSTADLLHRLCILMAKPDRLLPVSPELLRVVAKLLGKGDIAQRLLGNLQLDMSRTCQILGWEPPIGIDEGLRRAVKGFSL